MIPWGALLRLFPPEFREQFGEDLEEQVRRDHEAARRRGVWRGAAFVASTVVDLLRSALAERLRPTWKPRNGFARGVRLREPNRWSERMTGWTRELRHALRTLRRSPGFTAVTVVTLGLAIGANAGIFSVVDAVLLDALPYGEPERIVYIGATAPGSDFPEEFGVSAEFFLQYSEQSQLLESLSTASAGASTLRVDDRVERVFMAWPTPSLFEVLGVPPVLGRWPTLEDDDGVAVISHRLWRTWFGSDPEVIGRSYEMSGASRTIVGVMGPDFWFPDDQVELWISNPIRQAERIGRFGIPMVGRLAPGADREALAAELTQLASRLPERFGGSAGYARLISQHRAVVRPIGEQLIGSVSGALWVLLGAAGIVLLIACANLANLFLVRAEGRQRALALRRALGARRGQLLRVQMSEVAVIAALAGGLAVLLAWAGVPVFVRLAPADVPRIGSVTVGGDTLLFTLAASVLAALLSGLLPAARSTSPSLTRLREGGRGATRRRHWARNALVALQTALALVLLIGSGLLVRSFWELRHVDPGYDTEDVFSFQIAPDGEHLNDGPSFAAFHMDFMDRLRALPGVGAVGVVDNLPLDEGLRSQRIVTEGMEGPEDAALLRFTWSAGEYFEAMGIGVLRGRPFERADQLNPGNVVISAAAAELLWPGQDPVGQRLQIRDEDFWHTVVGVVEDAMQYSFRDVPDPLIYFPLIGPTPRSWAVGSPAYVVKTPRANSMAPEVRALVREAAPSAPMYRVHTLEGLARDSMVQLSFTMLTLGVASGLALILGALGLYGVLSYVVAERTQEIGVRMALGAEARRVRRMVVAQGTRVVVVGVALGVGVAVLSTRVLRTLLYQVEALDVSTFVAMSGTMLLVGLLASYVPARRASSVDPIESLRGE